MNKLRLSDEGVWYHEGVEITHARTIELFFKSVSFQNGRYFLTGEKSPVPIEVEDVAFFVRGLQKKDGELWIKISDGSEENLDVKTIAVGKDNQLYCLIKEGRAPAKFERKVYYELMKKLEGKFGYYGLEIEGIFYPIRREE